ncbi:MAG: hypothetical protein JO010_09345 [Alphaproteobacteria bacterium]|nr:hypothetical protein [Alphaproteobacteria bacterium]
MPGHFLTFEACMTRSLKHIAVTGLALLVLLAGCAAPPSRLAFPEIRFTQEPKLRLDVTAIDLQDDYHPTFHEPNVEHLFPVPPARAAENWVHDRLVAAGTTRRARVRITKASVIEVELPRTQGITGAFTTDQAQRYDAALEMSVDILSDRGFPERTASAQVARSQSVPEGITPNAREQVWYDMTKAMMIQIDQELETQMRAFFGSAIQ